jgi:hypothetical protein
MVLFRLLGSIVIFIEALGMTFLVPYEEKWAWLLTAIWSVSTANDLTITTTLVVLLHNQRNNLHRRYDFRTLPCRAKSHYSRHLEPRHLSISSSPGP